jgi:hypothetical protein
MATVFQKDDIEEQCFCAPFVGKKTKDINKEMSRVYGGKFFVA